MVALDEIALITVFVILFVATAIFLLSWKLGKCFFKRNIKESLRKICLDFANCPCFNRDGDSMAWRIDPRQLKFLQKAPGMGSVSNLLSTGSKHSLRTVSRNSSVAASMVISAYDKGTFAVYHGQVVVVKVHPRVQAIELTRENIAMLKKLRDIQHENLNTFVGMTFEVAQSVIVCWRYCSRGSLDDVLFNEDISLDMMFKASMMRDVVKGLEYLHKSDVGCHGKLSASHCVVDSRWLVKVSDYGMLDLYSKLLEDESIEMATPKTNALFHVAPELLRQTYPKPSKASDIYSFGMVLYQIVYRQQLFNEVFVPPQEVLADIIHLANPPLRPKLPKGPNAAFNQLMQQCWQEDPAERPLISAVKSVVHEATKDFSTNLMDHMVSMLEKYATNLEKIVEERTKQLEDERRRADALLCQLLPKPVADALKAGRHVAPESYNCCTVYFSDVVGFTTICSGSSPMQVVDMLNALYTQFDAIIARYDAYKVETIGDAYLVVSGLPTRNGSRHVTEIADLSLAIKKYVETSFIIPHLPGQKMKVRIGLHSGPCAAGVVGLSMPRYCVFGDTVNMASRLESSGLPLKIHISEATKDLLADNPHYVIACRGQLDLKGKGLCTTYWLEDHNVT